MAENCTLCDAARGRKYDPPTGAGFPPTTCVPGYVVPVRTSIEPTPWYHEDDLCWIAECEFCALPMVVSRAHDAEVSDEDRAAMIKRLTDIVVERYGYEPWFDAANLRIPEHFHVHARPVGKLFGHGFARVPVAIG